MAFPAWLPVTVSCFGAALSLFAFAWQVHRARFNQSIDLLFRLENDFFGSAKKTQRARASRNLLAGATLEAEPILDFFETMALLRRRGALDTEMVWHTFFYWIDRYFEATKTAIQDRQKIDPYIWKDLTLFVEKMREYQQTRPKGLPYHPPSPEEIIRFLEEESAEST